MNAPRSIQKNLDLVIEVYVKDRNYDFVLDKIIKEVKEKMFTDRLINSLAKDSFLTTQEITYNGEGDQTIGVGTLTYNVEYHHTEGTLG